MNSSRLCAAWRLTRRTTSRKPGETGLEDINWRQYDPRQYDPRVIVKQAFAEDDAEREREAKEREEALLKEKEKSESRALPRGRIRPPSTWDAT